jgi:predicted Zn-dependent protease
MLLGLSLALGPTGCTTNPATGERQFNVLSTEREVAMGEQAAPDFLKQYGGPIPDQQVQQVVKDLGQALAAKSERPDLPWEFHAVNSSHINAFALPGGKVFITRGLMAKFDNMAQLAGVLGHEVGHVTAEHIGQRMSQALVIQGLATGVNVAAQQSDEDWLRVLGWGTQISGGLYLLSFSRDQEYESDKLGLRYMTALDYNPVGQLQVMQILRRAGGSAGLEILSTHPLPQSRVQRLEKLIRRQYPDYEKPGAYRFGRDEYQEQILDRLQQLPPAKDVPKPQGRSSDQAQ